MKTYLIAAAGALALWASPARAALIAYDGFESYTAGAALNGGAGGTGWTSNWAAVTGVSTQSASVANGGTQAAEIADATNNVVSATRAYAAQTGTVYFGVTVNAAAGLEATDFLHFYLGNSGATNANSAGVGLLQTTSNAIGARVGTTNGGTTVDSATSAVQGTSYLLVGKVSKASSTNYNRIELFVNPAGATEPTVSDATQTADAGIATLSTFSVRSFNLEAGDRYQFDEVRVGTAFADVVPEPTAAGLLAAGGAVGLLRRRRAALG